MIPLATLTGRCRFSSPPSPSVTNGRVVEQLARLRRPGLVRRLSVPPTLADLGSGRAARLPGPTLVAAAIRLALIPPLAGAYLLLAAANLHRLRQLTDATNANPEAGAELEAWVTYVIGQGL